MNEIARIVTSIVGLTPDEWRQIGLAADALIKKGAPSRGLLILPGRPEFYLLRYGKPGGLTLELGTDEEAAVILAGGER